MKQENDKQQKIYTKIRQIRQQISSVVEKFSFEEICKVYRQISLEIMYLIKYVQNTISINRLIKDQLSQCSNELLVLVKSQYSQKYGSKLPIISRIVKYCQKLLGQRSNIVNQQKIFYRTQKNQSSTLYKITTQQLFSTQYLNLLKQKSDRLQSFFNYLSTNQILLQDPMCGGCSPILIKNLQIVNSNLKFFKIIGLPPSHGFNQFELAKNVSAILNNGGGIIIIGAETKNNQIITTGIKFKNQSQINQRIKQINQSLTKIKPPYLQQVQVVKVRNNFMIKDNPKDQYLRFCIRIIIFSRQLEKINYISSQNFKAYQTFKFNHVNQLKKVLFQEINQNLYKLIHTKYHNFKKKSRIIDAHQYCLCRKPQEKYSIFFEKFINDGGIFQQQSVKPLILQKKMQIKVYDDDPKFKYEYSSLLVLPSKKNRPQKEDFINALIQKKQIFELSQPFPNSFGQGGRLIYLICHKIKHNSLKNFYIDLIKSGVLKNDGSIILMPVHDCLQIERAKLTNSNQLHIKKKIMQRYNIQCHTETHKVPDLQGQNLIQKVYFFLQTIDKAIYAYLLFEQLKLRPYFVKQANKFIQKKLQSKK